jgi:hypothetical protein
MIILGIILLIAGFLLKISILWTIGIIVLIIGVVLAILGNGTRCRWPPPLLLAVGRRLPCSSLPSAFCVQVELNRSF